MTVEYHGFSSAPATLPVIGSAPGLFTLDASGRGPGAILNQDFSLNSAAKPAPKGSTVMIFATGEGQTEPAGIDGQITGTILGKPKLRVSATIGDVPAHVSYAGSAPGLVAGVLQVNVRVPDEASSGPAVPVRITVGTSTSQASVTIAIQ